MATVSATPVCDAYTDEWLDERRKGLTSTDAAAIVLGKSFGRTTWDVFLDKYVQDDTPARAEPEPEYLRLGRDLEPYVRERLSREIGMYVSERIPLVVGVAGPSLWRSQKHEWLMCTPDGVVLDEDGEIVAIAELKTAGTLSKWDDGIPPVYEIQCYHQMLTMGVSTCYIAVLAGGHQGMAFRWARIELEDWRADVILSALTNFWHNHVQQGVPPDPDGEKSTRDAIHALYPEGDPEKPAVALDGSFIDLDEELAGLKDQMVGIRARVCAIENRIKMTMGDAETAYTPNGTRYTWRSQERKQYTVPAAKVRVLRRRAPKDD